MKNTYSIAILADAFFRIDTFKVPYHASEIIIIRDSIRRNNVLKKVQRVVHGGISVVEVCSPLGEDFSAQRNLAFTYATSDWIFFLDSDEHLSEELDAEISAKLSDPSINGYAVRRTDTFMGTRLRFGETGRVRLTRLVRKNRGTWKRPVHEVLQVQGNIGMLRSPLAHTPHKDLESFLGKINWYTTIEANYRIKEGKEFHYTELFLFPPMKFLYNYFFRLGFFDGVPGFIMAWMMSFHSLIVRIKMYGA